MSRFPDWAGLADKFREKYPAQIRRCKTQRRLERIDEVVWLVWVPLQSSSLKGPRSSLGCKTKAGAEDELTVMRLCKRKTSWLGENRAGTVTGFGRGVSLERRDLDRERGVFASACIGSFDVTASYEIPSSCSKSAVPLVVHSRIGSLGEAIQPALRPRAHVDSRGKHTAEVLLSAP